MPSKFREAIHLHAIDGGDRIAFRDTSTMIFWRDRTTPGQVTE